MKKDPHYIFTIFIILEIVVDVFSIYLFGPVKLNNLITFLQRTQT